MKTLRSLHASIVQIRVRNSDMPLSVEVAMMGVMTARENDPTIILVPGHWLGAWTWDEVFAHFLEESGKHFDPCLVDILLENKEEFVAIWEEYHDECGVCAGRGEALQAGSGRPA